jgi:hypothetical protein
MRAVPEKKTFHATWFRGRDVDAFLAALAVREWFTERACLLRTKRGADWLRRRNR